MSTIIQVPGQFNAYEYDTPLANVSDLHDDSNGKNQPLADTLAEKVVKEAGKGLSTNDYTTDEKTKLAGIATGAEVNQNAFSTVKVGNTNIQADSKTDMLTLIAGDNVTLTPNATNDSIEISATRGGDPVDAYTKAQSDARYVQQEAGKQLSTNDYTDSDKKAVETIGDKNYAAGKDRGMGRIILAKNQSLQSQLTQTNTIYSVQYDIKVNGGSILLSPSNTMQYGGATYYYGEVVLNNGETIQASSASTKIFVQNSGYQWIDEGTSYTSSQNDLVVRLGVVAYTSNKIDFTFTGQTSATVPAGCILDFDGGSISGGTLVGNNTKLSGYIRIENMSGSFDGEIKSTMSTLTANHAKLAMLMGLTIDTLILDEDYTIDSSERIATTIPNIIGKGITMDVTSDIPLQLLMCTGIKSLSGIYFDFNNHATRGAVVLSSSNDFSISDIKVSDLKNSMTNSSVSAIHVTVTADVVCSISDLQFSNLSCLSNGTVGDDKGFVYGLFVSVASNNAQVNVKSVIADELYSFNSSNVKTDDDSSVMYISDTNINSNNSRVIISNIQAKNCGRRSIKTDVRYLTVADVDIESNDSRNLVGVGANTADVTVTDGEIKIDGVRFTGNSGAVVATAIPNTIINNVVGRFPLDRESDASILSIGDGIAGVRCTGLSGENCALIKQINTSLPSSPVNISNVDLYYGNKASGTFAVFNVANANLSISNIGLTSVKNLSFNYSNSSPGTIVLNNADIKAETTSNYYLFEVTSKLSLEMNNFVVNYNGRGIFNLSDAAVFKMRNGHVVFDTTVSTGLLMLGSVTLTSNFENFTIENVTMKNPGTRTWDVGITNSSGADATVRIDGENMIGLSGNDLVNITGGYNRIRSNDISKLGTAKGSKVAYMMPDGSFYKLHREQNGWVNDENVSLSTSNFNSISGITFATGMTIFDYDKGKPIYRKLSTWVYADGSSVS